jgi:hypothetical protein
MSGGSSAHDGLVVALSCSTNPQSTSDLTSTIKEVSTGISTTVTVDSLNNNNNVDNNIIDKASGNSTMTTTVTHVDATNESSLRCTCGCVPNVMSLFEMAALRAEYRKRMKASEHK